MNEQIEFLFDNWLVLHKVQEGNLNYRVYPEGMTPNTAMLAGLYFIGSTAEEAINKAMEASKEEGQNLRMSREHQGMTAKTMSKRLKPEEEAALEQFNQENTAQVRG